MKRIIKVIASIILLFIFALGVVACGGKSDSSTIDILVVWPGLSGAKPSDQQNNAVANVIKERTGLTVNVTFSDVEPAQKLTSIFAIGRNMPSVIMCPYYGTNEGESKQLKMAAKDGLLLSWDEYITDAENLTDAFNVGLASGYIENGLGAEEFGGKKYLLPMHTAATVEDETNWGYTVYGRKDILDALGVDPTSIHTSEQIYDLTKQIQAGIVDADGNKIDDFKDINGNKVIPASCWQNGWAYEVFLNSYKYRQFTSIIEHKDENAECGFTLEWLGMNDIVVQEAKFMNKMIKEGLFDKEAFTQSDSTAVGKYVTGSVALTGAHYTGIQSQLEYSLYAEHPEMRYVPIGPIYDANGNARMPETYRMNGVSGGPVMVMTKDCKNPEAVVKYLNYINSEEGKKLVYFGIEGEDYTVTEDGIKMTEEYFNNVDQNSKYGVDRGIDAVYTYGVSRLHNNEYEKAYLRSGTDEATVRQQAKDMYPLELVDGVVATNWDKDFSRYDELIEIMLTNDYSTIIQSAYFAESDIELTVAIKNYRKAINQDGIMDEYLAYVKQKVIEARAKGINVLF